jgi:multiple RNA-binding domain-containing protein 1
LTTLYVGNLSPDATASDLRAVFSPFGEIGSLRVARDRAGRARGFALVELKDEAAAAAMDALKGTELKGRMMDVVVESASPAGKRHGGKGGRGFRRRR